jgi:hypothetical protein
MKVDDKLKQMETSMRSINELATKIDANFKVKRGEIQKLTTINKELQKVSSISYPNATYSCIDEEYLRVPCHFTSRTE